MKKQKIRILINPIIIAYIMLACISVCLFSSCKKQDKPESYMSDKTYTHSKEFSEIGLKITFSYKKAVNDNFKVSLSEGFEINDQFSYYNVEQGREYFNIRCYNKKEPNVFYNIMGHVDSKSDVAVVRYGVVDILKL